MTKCNLVVKNLSGSEVTLSPTITKLGIGETITIFVKEVGSINVTCVGKDTDGMAGYAGVIQVRSAGTGIRSYYDDAGIVSLVINEDLTYTLRQPGLDCGKLPIGFAEMFVGLPPNTDVVLRGSTRSGDEERVRVVLDDGRLFTLLGQGEGTALPEVRFNTGSFAPFVLGATVTIEHKGADGVWKHSALRAGPMVVDADVVKKAVQSEDSIDADWNDANIAFEWPAAALLGQTPIVEMA